MHRIIGRHLVIHQAMSNVSILLILCVYVCEREKKGEKVGDWKEKDRDASWNEILKRLFPLKKNKGTTNFCCVLVEPKTWCWYMEMHNKPQRRTSLERICDERFRIKTIVMYTNGHFSHNRHITDLCFEVKNGIDSVISMLHHIRPRLLYFKLRKVHFQPLSWCTIQEHSLWLTCQCTHSMYL